MNVVKDKEIELNSDVKKLLDVISSIVANEYIETAKENPEIFENGGKK